MSSRLLKNSGSTRKAPVLFAPSAKAHRLDPHASNGHIWRLLRSSLVAPVSTMSNQPIPERSQHSRPTRHRTRLLNTGSIVLTILVFAMAASAPPLAAKAKTPRFASTRSDRTNVRAGPGLKYPIRWVYRRRGLPLEIRRDYGHWRYVRDTRGDSGWIHRSTLSGRRTVIVMGRVRILRAKPSVKAAMVARAEPNVIGRLATCKRYWCRIIIGKVRGWVRRRHIWGVRKGERF